MVFPVVMWRCEIWILKKTDRQRIDAFKLGCWRRLLIISWTAGSNQSILNEISPCLFIGGTDAKAEAQIIWPSDAKS